MKNGLQIRLENKLKLIAATREFKQAFQDMNKHWDYAMGTGMHINYPFHKSFDELEVDAWCDEILDRIAVLPLDIEVPNMKCTTCSMYAVTPNGMKYCLAGEPECGPLRVQFDRQTIINWLLEAGRDVMHDDFEDESYQYIAEGNTGLNQMTDFELFCDYMSYIGGEAHKQLHIKEPLEVFLDFIKTSGWIFYDQLGGGCQAMEKQTLDGWFVITDEAIALNDFSIVAEESQTEEEVWWVDTTVPDWTKEFGRLCIESQVPLEVYLDVLAAYTALNKYYDER